MNLHKECMSPDGTILASRRFVITAAACEAVLPAAAPALADTTGPASAEDEQFMRMALDEARHGDLPYGTVIVRDGYPTAHGEMLAIRQCLAAHGSATLAGSTLYATAEPCVMCMGAIIWSRLGRLVFGASKRQLPAKLDTVKFTSAEIAAKAPFAPIPITGGVLADEQVKLFSK
jgi:tRNA(adenine34) deaminase